MIKSWLFVGIFRFPRNNCMVFHLSSHFNFQLLQFKPPPGSYLFYLCFHYFCAHLQSNLKDQKHSSQSFLTTLTKRNPKDRRAVLLALVHCYISFWPFIPNFNKINTFPFEGLIWIRLRYITQEKVTNHFRPCK